MTTPFSFPTIGNSCSKPSSDRLVHLGSSFPHLSFTRRENIVPCPEVHTVDAVKGLIIARAVTVHGRTLLTGNNHFRDRSVSNNAILFTFRSAFTNWLNRSPTLALYRP